MVQENNSETDYKVNEIEESSMFSFEKIYRMVVLNWKWFLLSLVACIGIAFACLRYTTPVYQVKSKLLIKDDDNPRNRSKNDIMTSASLGIISNSTGLQNELEILKSNTIATEAVNDLKLYVEYKSAGRLKKNIIYKTQPVTVSIDEAHLKNLEKPIRLTIKRTGNKYRVNGTYIIPAKNDKPESEPQTIDREFDKLPFTINTNAGILSFTKNFNVSAMKDGSEEIVTIYKPRKIADKYINSLSTETNKMVSQIASLVINDEIPARAVDYLNQLVFCYNEQANQDKNVVALRTEAFINERVNKINSELGTTESAIEQFKRSNSMVDLQANAAQALANSDSYDQKLAEANAQTMLINSIIKYMREPANKYQTLPSNIGLTDQSTTALIDKYNEVVLKRSRLLQSASESSPTVEPYTVMLDELSNSINKAMDQAKQSLDIQRKSIASQYGKYTGRISEAPIQEKVLGQIGRQQEVKAQLYLMLLQKREENSISLAATADKGKLIDEPSLVGKISPKGSIILAMGFIFGLLLPAGILFLLEFFRYKIEGHEDVAKLTRLPIIADIAVASDTAKTRADIVVHENNNGYMEEIFRSMRTNLQFMLKEGEKTIMFTSSTSGEGKTFITSNLAISLALLGKKVVLVGLDIRKPRLAELFEINNHRTGITNLLVCENPTYEDVRKQILPSEVNGNLDLLMAGPIPPNPAELIARPSLGQVLDILKEHYDYIIIDTAPIGLVTDTQQIAKYANVSVYVCRADYTPKDCFNIVNGLAAEGKIQNLCIAINGVDLSKKKYGYSYGYGKYGKYGKYGHSHAYGNYGSGKGYGYYGHYGSSENRYVNKDDNSIKH